MSTRTMAAVETERDDDYDTLESQIALRVGRFSGPVFATDADPDAARRGRRHRVRLHRRGDGTGRETGRDEEGHDMTDEWKARLRKHLGGNRTSLRATDFSDTGVVVVWDDGSVASFRYAFPVWSEDGESVTVFTEYCGYHLFRVVVNQLTCL